MSANWDIFGDEQKAANGRPSAIGLLCVERGVVCQLAQHLLVAKSKLQGTGRDVGSPHWRELKERQDELLVRWLDIYFEAPCVFFVYVPSTSATSRLDLVAGAIERLEGDSRVLHGLDRKHTTLHLDYDNQDARELDMRLVRRFGLLRAFHWNDRGSPLLQLTDVLLGIAERDYTGRGFAKSACEDRRRRVVEHARQVFTRKRRNHVVAYEPSGETRTLLLETPDGHDP